MEERIINLTDDQIVAVGQMLLRSVSWAPFISPIRGEADPLGWIMERHQPGEPLESERLHRKILKFTIQPTAVEGEYILSIYYQNRDETRRYGIYLIPAALLDIFGTKEVPDEQIVL